MATSTNVVYLSGPTQPLWKPLAIAGASTLLMLGVLIGADIVGIKMSSFVLVGLLAVYLYVNGLTGYKYVKQAPPGSVEVSLTPAQLADAFVTWPHILDTGIDPRSIPTAISYYQRAMTQAAKAKRDAAAAQAAQIPTAAAAPGVPDSAYLLTPEQAAAPASSNALQQAVDNLIPQPAPVPTGSVRAAPQAAAPRARRDA